MTTLERLEQAWIAAGYPREHMPRTQFHKVADEVASAFAEGEADFIRAGWTRAKVDFPFAPSHPRYQAMQDAYRALAEAARVNIEPV